MSKGVIAGLALLGGMVALGMSQAPEIRRYLKLRSM
ncbi:MAG: DUF6893 family small protein [Thermoleophilaceae bacterium]